MFWNNPTTSPGVREAMSKTTLSACLIVKDEILTIERIVRQALEVADEVIVVDTGSSDGTPELACKLGATVKFFEWVDDFSAARNYAFAQCSMEWILWLDADDVLPKATIAVIKALLAQPESPLKDPDMRAVWSPYHYQFGPDGKVSQIVNRERLLRNFAGHKWVGPIHETIDDAYTDSSHCAELIIEHRTAPENNVRRKGRNRRYLEKFIDLETSELRWLWLYGSELASDLEFDASNRVLIKYWERSQGLPDPIGERYAVQMKLAFNAITQKQPEVVANWAMQMLAQDAQRAEGYTCLAVAFLQRNVVHAAWPMLIAALQCRRPAVQNIIIIDPLYHDEPMSLIKQIVANYPAIREDVDKLLGVAIEVANVERASRSATKAAEKKSRRAGKKKK
jgi:Glycosyl transferase family 2